MTEHFKPFDILIWFFRDETSLLSHLTSIGNVAFDYQTLLLSLSPVHSNLGLNLTFVKLVSRPICSLDCVEVIHPRHIFCVNWYGHAGVRQRRKKYCWFIFWLPGNWNVTLINTSWCTFIFRQTYNDKYSQKRAPLLSSVTTVTNV